MTYSAERDKYLGKKAEVFVAKVLIDAYGKDAVKYVGANCYYHDLEVWGVGPDMYFEVKAQHATERTGRITLVYSSRDRVTLDKCDADYYMFVTSVGLFKVDKPPLQTYAHTRLITKHATFRETENGDVLVSFELAWLRKQAWCQEIQTHHPNPLSPQATRHLTPVRQILASSKTKPRKPKARRF